MAALAFAHLLGNDSNGGRDHGVRRLAAELVGDMARSPLVLGLLEAAEEEEQGDDDEGAGGLLYPFLHEAAAALTSRDGPCCWHAPLLRGLRLLCLQSPLARSRLARVLLLMAGREGHGLAALVRLALGPHAPTASEAVGLLQACLPLSDEHEEEEVGLWQRLAEVMLLKQERAPRTPLSPLRLMSSPARSHKTRSPPSAATAQLNRSPARRAAAAAARAAAVRLPSSLVERLAGEIAALADEVEVATAGADGMILSCPMPPERGKGGGAIGGGGGSGGLAMLEVEWRLRSLLSFAALLTHAPAPAPLARAVAGRLSPCALGAISLGLARLAHAQSVAATHASPGHDAAFSASSVMGATAVGGALSSAGALLPPKATESLEVIVLGCRLLLRGSLAAAQQEEEESSEGARRSEHARWRSAVLGESKEVAAALYLAWSQGTSRELLEGVRCCVCFACSPCTTQRACLIINLMGACP